MTLPIDVREPGEWLGDEGPNQDVVLSSRIRLARNLSDFSFPSRADADDKERVLEMIRENLSEIRIAEDWEFLEFRDCTDLEKKLLKERRLASDDLIREPYSGVYFRHGETLSLMVNEEDHLRLQALQPGDQLDRCFEWAQELERELNQEVSFAFDEEWGYLTSCPTNLGTGLRASVLLHLPALVLNQRFQRVLKAVANLGLTVRGFYGEGSGSQGFYFQLSNQVTLGQTAEEMKNNLQRVVTQLVEQERKARRRMVDSEDLEAEDKIWRAYGVLRHARTMDETEALQLISFARLGASLERFEGVGVRDFDAMLMRMQPAHLHVSVGEQLRSEQQDHYRSKLIRELLSETRPRIREGQDGSGTEDRQ